MCVIVSAPPTQSTLLANRREEMGGREKETAQRFLMTTANGH